MRDCLRQDVKKKRRRKISLAVLVSLVLALLVVQVYAQTAVYRLALENQQRFRQLSGLEEEYRQLSRIVPGEGAIRRKAMELGMIPLEEEGVRILSVLED